MKSFIFTIKYIAPVALYALIVHKSEKYESTIISQSDFFTLMMLYFIIVCIFDIKKSLTMYKNSKIKSFFLALPFLVIIPIFIFCVYALSLYSY